LGHVLPLGDPRDRAAVALACAVHPCSAVSGPLDEVADGARQDGRSEAPTGLWSLMNSTQLVDGRAMRLACTVLLLAYGAIVLTRYQTGQGEFLWSRLAICGYAVLGIRLSQRVTFPLLRAYTVGLALLLPLQAAWVDGLLGNRISDVAVTALATFVPLVFLQTARDFVLVAVVLALGHAAILWTGPASEVAPSVVALVVGGALASGTALGMVTTVYRVRWADTVRQLRGALAERRRAEVFRAAEAATSAALARVGRELISSLETPILLDRLCRVTTEVLGCDIGQTWLWNADDQVYEPLSSWGLSAEVWTPLQLVRIPSGPSTPLIARLEREEVVQVTASSRAHPVVAALLAHHRIACVLCVALRRGGDVIGVQLAGYRERPDEPAPAFTPHQEGIARGIAQLASMAISNARLVEELERASRLKSEFVSTISHELRTPLNVILGYLDMLADQVEGAAPARILGRVRQSSLELLELVEATLNLNRIASGKDLPCLETVALDALGDELRHDYEPVPRAPGVRLLWEIEPGIALVTDRQKLKMIVKNLVGNALKFTSAGEVAVRMGYADGRCVVTVRDTGIGIAADHLPHVFDMFRQVDSSDARRFGGVGLGLYIVKSLLAQLGGTIEVESAPSVGSTFRLTLPAAPAAASSVSVSLVALAG